MFFAHLNVFLAFIAFLLFVFRFKQQIFAERLLSVFSFIYLLNTTLFLTYLYYNFDQKILIDSFGVVSELITLSLPVGYIIFIKRPVQRNLRLIIIVGFILFVSISTVIHHLIADDSGFLLYPDNINAIQNINFQIFIDIFLLSYFFLLFNQKHKQKESEIFDGKFKFSLGIVFISYYLLDILILSVMGYFTSNEILNGFVYYFNNILNFIVVLLLIYIAIQTNWLEEWHRVKKSPGMDSTLIQKFELEPLNQHLVKSQLEKLQIIDYQNLKTEFFVHYQNIFERIDQFENLSKTEKMYLFFLHFDIPHKDLADVLHVSNRTIETNFYRVRKKIQKQPL